MKIAAYTTIFVILGWTIIAVLQLWFQFMTASLFTKITITAILIVIALVIAAVIHREYSNDKELKKNNYID